MDGLKSKMKTHKYVVNQVLTDLPGTHSYCKSIALAFIEFKHVLPPLVLELLMLNFDVGSKVQILLPVHPKSLNEAIEVYVLWQSSLRCLEVQLPVVFAIVISPPILSNCLSPQEMFLLFKLEKQ